jgi:cell division protein FtsI (penicillin-binding protein 3)
VIKNKPFAKKYLGAAVAGPVFREVADKLMSMEAVSPDRIQLASYTALLKKDSTAYYYAGSSEEIKSIMQTIHLYYADSTHNQKWVAVYRENDHPVIKVKNEDRKRVPDVKGMGLKDALFLLESNDIQVATRGTGKVKQQSISAGTIVSKNQKLILDLN